MSVKQRKGCIMNLSDIIAANLKKLRTERNLSLGQLAELSTVSKVMLSQIEKGESNPTINTIWKIANGLKVPYTQLIDEIKNDTIIIRKEDCLEQTGEDPSYRVFSYFKTTPTRNFELFRVELDPNCSYMSNGHAEKSHEYILVIHGELILKTTQAEYTLRNGDSIFFDPSHHHTYINNQDNLLKFVVVNYYP